MKVKKLELKHLAVYLPYGLKCEILDYKCDYVGDKYDTVKGYYMIGDGAYFNFKSGRDHADKNANNFKPILHPLSDLTKLIKINGSFITPCKWFGLEPNEKNQTFLETKIIEKWMSFKEMEVLIKHHFDIYGLIESGLAIDINTLKS